MLTERLARFIVESRWDALPGGLRREAGRSLLNSLGCALGVADSAPVAQAARALAPFSGPDRATLFGRAERLDMLGAVFVNAVGANLLDYDDTHLRTVIHPAAPVAPVVLALAETRSLSGADALHALLLGMEVECRIGNAVSPTHYARGWHITSTCGAFGAAAAAAKLLGLDASRTAHALGVAASLSAGIVENLPTGGKNASVGSAARGGLFAALLAEQGYEAAPAAIEGPLGWARAMGDAPDVAAVLDRLGDVWEAGKNTYKPYPCGIVMHAVIDACLVLRRDHRLTADDIASVEIRGDQLLLDRGDRVVRSGRDARVSIHHCAAVAFLFGAAGLLEFDDPVVSAPEVAAFRGRVAAKLDAAAPKGAATATVRTRDGRVLSATVANPKGSEADPLSDAELEAKFRDSAAYGGFAGSCDAAIAAIRGLARAGTVGALMAALRAPEPVIRGLDPRIGGGTTPPSVPR